MHSERLPSVTILAQEVGAMGGTEAQVGKLVQGYLDAGGSVTLVSRAADVAPHPRLSVMKIPGPRRPFVLREPWFLVLSWIRLRFARQRTDLLHATGAIYLGRVDVSTVHFCHTAYAASDRPTRSSRAGHLGKLAASLSRRLTTRLERHCYSGRRVRALVGVSSGVRRELRTFFPEVADRVSVISNAVDGEAVQRAVSSRGAVRAALLRKPDRRIALFVGGDWPRKGLDMVVEAIGGSPGWELVVVGRGDVDRYSALAAHHGADDRLTFLGQRDDVHSLYAAADAFVLPSTYETFSLVTYEAALAGLPLLVAPASGIEDLVEHGKTGWYVTTPGEISSRLERIEADWAGAQAVGERARRKASSYNAVRMVDGYIRLYSELIIRR